MWSGTGAVDGVQSGYVVRNGRGFLLKGFIIGLLYPGRVGDW